MTLLLGLASGALVLTGCALGTQFDRPLVSTMGVACVYLAGLAAGINVASLL